jgi:hypothetical protein
MLFYSTIPPVVMVCWRVQAHRRQVLQRNLVGDGVLISEMPLVNLDDSKLYTISELYSVNGLE